MYDGEAGDGIEDSAKYPAQPPPPVPPSFAKTEIYRDPTEFAEVDRRAINVAQEDQKTFTDLVKRTKQQKQIKLPSFYVLRFELDAQFISNCFKFG